MPRLPGGADSRVRPVRLQPAGGRACRRPAGAARPAGLPYRLGRASSRRAARAGRLARGARGLERAAGEHASRCCIRRSTSRGERAARRSIPGPARRRRHARSHEGVLGEAVHRHPAGRGLRRGRGGLGRRSLPQLGRGRAARCSCGARCGTRRRTRASSRMRLRGPCRHAARPGRSGRASASSPRRPGRSPGAPSRTARSRCSRPTTSACFRSPWSRAGPRPRRRRSRRCRPGSPGEAPPPARWWGVPEELAGLSCYLPVCGLGACVSLLVVLRARKRPLAARPTPGRA